MRGLFIIAVGGALVLSAAPAMAAPQQGSDVDEADCAEQAPKKKQVKSMTEPVPVRKKDRERIKRILM